MSAERLVAWLDFGDAWARAFEADAADAETMFRLGAECWKAGARRAKLLPLHLHPDDDEAAFVPAPLPASSVWDAGQDGDAPTLVFSGAVGWLRIDGEWVRAHEDADVNACVTTMFRLCAERGATRWKVLPEGTDPDDDDTPG